MSMVNELFAVAWRAAGPLQGRIAWCLNAKFNVGVTGIVRAGDGRVLLLRHRLWPEHRQWGFPSGFAKRHERFQDAVVREVREETGLTVTVGRLLDVRASEQWYLTEVYYEAALAGSGSTDGLVIDRKEILEARLFPLGGLPPNMPDTHRELALGERRLAPCQAG